MLGNHPTWRVGTALSLHCSDRPNTLIWYIPSCEQQLLTCKPKQTCPALWHWTRLPAGRRWSYCVFLFNFFSCVMAMAFVNYLTNSLACILSGANHFLYCETWTLNSADHRCFIFLLISNPHDISKMSHIASHFNRTSEPHQLNHHVMLIASHLPVWRLKR
jgi:hypothetical protein